MHWKLTRWQCTYYIVYDATVMKLVLNRLLLFLVAMKGTAKNEEQKLFFSQKQFDFGCSLTSEVISNIVMTEDANWLPIPLVNGRQSGKLAVTFKLLRTRSYLYFLYSILDLVSVFKKLNPRHDVITCRAHPVMTSLLKRTYWTYCCCCCCFHRMCQGFRLDEAIWLSLSHFWPL